MRTGDDKLWLNKELPLIKMDNVPDTTSSKIFDSWPTTEESMRIRERVIWMSRDTMISFLQGRGFTVFARTPVTNLTYEQLGNALMHLSISGAIPFSDLPEPPSEAEQQAGAKPR